MTKPDHITVLIGRKTHICQRTDLQNRKITTADYISVAVADTSKEANAIAESLNNR